MRTEEEQVEALKNWWRENGRSTLLGVGLAALAVFGWKAWQQHEQQTMQAGAMAYQSLMTAAATQPGAQLDGERRKTATHLAGQLKEEHQDSAYGLYAALWLAKSAAETGNLDQATAELEWVLAQEPESAIAEAARLRLARLKLAQGDPQGALARLEGAAEEGFQAAFYEIQGDAYQALGEEGKARAAYESALAASANGGHPLLSMKLDDVAAIGAQDGQ
nr:tetratricopeptide repeat protein [Motiliproteus sp. SC1-56]